tara:strand:+ start:412 stop:1194 length:783 start_codon:yes stop_codon:yes gene_type:complete
MRFFFFHVFLTLFLFSCETKRKDSSDVLARVSGKTLTIRKAQKINGVKPLDKESIPKTVSDWITNTVLLKKGIEMDLHKDSLLLKKRDRFFNSLIISSFLKQNHHPKINVLNKEILDYYDKNKESFFRETDEVFLEHYFTEKLAFSKKLKSFFVLNKKPDINVSDFLLESKTVKKGRTSDQFSTFIFDSKDEVVGPIQSKDGYHFFKVLSRYKKGSSKGLEMVYDEIFQRLYKKKEKNRSLFYLDSIKNTEEIYINPKYQ